MTMISDLPMDLVEEILLRIPLTSTREMRSTCKKWNALSRDGTFTKKHLGRATKEREGDFLVILLADFNLYLKRFNLRGGIHNNSDPSVKTEGKLKSQISQVYDCEGLLLCTTVDNTRLVVWNPYTGQTRWISVEPRSSHPREVWYSHALGYDMSKSHKILRFSDHDGPDRKGCVYEIYELNSNSWRILDVTWEWYIDHDSYVYGVSLKGNTYWFASDDFYRVPDFLLCFDFTRERFGKHLHMPFETCWEDNTVILSSVREEQLAVLFQSMHTLEMKIWVTTKIDPDEVSWMFLLKVDMKPLTGFRFRLTAGGSFFIDEEKRAVVVVDGDKGRRSELLNIAYIIGENGYYREVDLGESKGEWAYVCSYVPSSVQINQPA